MTDTIQTPAATATDEASKAVQAEEFLYLDPVEIIIGTNVRTDLRADHKEFRKSIKERGVLEAVTVYRNEDGQYVLLRGQRRNRPRRRGRHPHRVDPCPRRPPARRRRPDRGPDGREHPPRRDARG